MLLLLLLCGLFVFLRYIVGYIIYRQTTYYKNTHNSYFSVLHDKGLYGEYKIYMNLRSFEKQGARFLFNCYIPRENGTTEIDVVMLWYSGLYIFESKNYSGWIFGNEYRKVWTQCLPRGKGRSANKIKFFNPIMQNKLHIRCLKELLKDGCPEIHSIIVFSDRCTLKDITTHSGYKDISVIYRSQVGDTVDLINRATPEMTPDLMIDEIYSFLVRFTNASDDVKMAHIAAIQNRLNGLSENEVINENEISPVAANVGFDNVNIVPPIEIIPQQTDALSNIIKKCPRCGSPLALRTAKKGPNAGKQFYGCNNFPKCRYTEQL